MTQRGDIKMRPSCPDAVELSFLIKNLIQNSKAVKKGVAFQK